MTTIVINSKSKAAKDFIDYVKKLPFAKIIEDKEPTKEPTKETSKAISEARSGKTIKCGSFDDYLKKMKDV